MIIPRLEDLVLEQDGEEGLEEVGRRILSEGLWSTVAYLVRTRPGWDAPWEGPFLWLHRYQKVPQGWKLVSRFHTTDACQLAQLLRALKDWGLFDQA